MSTLRQMKEEGWRIWLHCRSQAGQCTHSWQASWDQLIQYFGPDADFVKDRSGFDRLVCERCGGRGASIIVLPAADTPGMGGPGGAHDHTPPPAEVLEEMHRQGEIVAQAVDRQRQATAAQRAKNAAERKAKRDIEAGRDLIGPPNPWKHRRRGRWL